MAGLFFIIFGTLATLFLIIYFKDTNFEFCGGLGIIFSVIFIGFIIAIPTSRNDCKSNIVKAEQLQILLDSVRKNNAITQFEKISIMDKVINYNETIADWHVKSVHWYQNKWYYIPEAKEVKFIH